MSFKARVLSALGVECVLVLIGVIVLAQLNAPDAYDQVLFLAVGVPVGLYMAWAIVRERDDLEREQRG